MSDVLHDEWDRAYEEGREAGRREAWSGDYDYRKLMEEVRKAERAATLAEVHKWVMGLPYEIDGEIWLDRDDVEAIIRKMGENL